MAQSSMESNLMSNIVYTKLHQFFGLKFSFLQILFDQMHWQKWKEFCGYF